MAKNRVVEIVSGGGNRMSINTKNLDAMYINNRTIHFKFSSGESMNSLEYNNIKLAETEYKKVFNEWKSGEK